ncbi:glycosyl transferase family group 2-domain-containing protein [Desarmillaria tabescens]|uniref:Glycosyl transferase family group 2-domain-containing protein n=1 Tax=Armillaria tabescens TaxID=1929756 RepID=A0AA39KBG8_ARMTA|nr:glycosyl transferase family group 2-domain-containing protein [Desarmillaria tabescens]KAK0458084.1 glycosyl transferase family group 2-domain-containing protein [Desarmillaria tabescens]
MSTTASLQASIPSSGFTIYNSDYDAFDALLHNIYENTLPNNCNFRVFPYENAALVPFEQSVRKLNPAVAVKIKTASVHVVISSTPLNDTAIQIDHGTRIQILESMDMLPMAEKDQCGAFIRNDDSVVLWAYAVDSIVPLCKEFEEKLIKYIWRTRGSPKRDTNTPPLLESHSENQSMSSSANLRPIASSVVEETVSEKETSPQPPPPRKKSRCGDIEKAGGRRREHKRKNVLLGPFYAGCGAAMALYFVGAGISILLEEYALDGDMTRFALAITLPVIFCVSLFFCLQLIGNVSLIIGPVAQYHENSAFYSAVRPEPNPEIDNNLPHITIQCPVYKESLELTIAPSVFSIKKAMQTYARQGGTSAIFICDDGLQLIPEKDRQERIDFYANHNIGWVARPPHSSKEGGFKRAGKFKKASNMNYGLALSIKLEKHLADLIAQGEDQNDQPWMSLEDRAMNMAIEEMYEESGRKWKPWASNGQSLRVGEIILIIDADTVVPEDCFRDAAREMGESEDVAIIQHESDVMQVAHHYFENGITHFTRRINKCISYGCANGEVAPFVGHNAFLRWSAVQDASFVDAADGKRKQWSEANVSEDFDLALRLLLRGYTLRWATYSNGGFKEGVSLTVVDELARWQKYAYGCDEIIFNPIVRWWRQGPISAQLRGFMCSKAPIHYKIGMSSYMFSYYGIAAATVGSIVNYLLLGLAPELDKFYLHSFEILLACVVVFPALGNVGFTLLEYRLGHRQLFAALIENLRWVPFFLFFFGGLSIHLSTALLAHMFSYDMTWGSTGKEVEKSTFWIEVPRILKGFRLSFVICFALIIMMIVFASNAVPYEWQIWGYQFALIIPLSLVVGCHILLPIVLNPWLMKFSY